MAGGGAAKTNTLWSTTEEIARSAYRIFHARGFKNTDIYLMSPDTWCDFNGDGFDDHVVDCPPSNEDRDPAISDVEYAITDWAVTNYTEDTPLFVYLIDHGYSDDGNGPYFQVSSGENLYASQLDEFLDAYEAATGGQVVVVNESCYSGEFLAGLKKSGRVVVSSAGADLVKYTSTGANSFSNFFLKHLYNNQSLSQAFSLAAQDLKIYASTQDQTPWMDDNGDGLCDVSDGLLASQIKLGGDFVLGASWPEILGAECGACISGTAVLTATVSANMNRVWAEIEPPGYEPDDSQGFIHLDLPFINLADSDGDLVYTGEYGGFTQTGVYVVSLFAKDHYGNTTTWDPINVPIGLDDKGSVTGSVKIVFTDNDAVSVQAAAGAVTVRIAGTDCQAQVDSNGDFTIYGVSPGEYTVIISSAGFDSVEVSGVSVTVGETSALGSVELPVQTSQAIPCDMNNDGRRDVKDALEIIQEAVGN
ncbi:carboxypeptidase regulatory-like domain-containing protein [Desulfatibacillum aliphaticivorans]|uniref:carboxypeptidase regulatory-like domain-containing protein n=1 Tax=Desulfatibacillum aliphaticivorans TaxID=218208 RepID=UPI001D0439E1|nr:carboxypeptidase regulatory-like domain-containing protein [Desulfatibacillum aliphaticivorans]